MSYTIPAMRGKLGSTEYYIVTMKGKEVAEKMRAAAKVEGWEDLSLEQKYQRQLDLKRVRNDIAPYLAQDEDRFFGSLIVAVQNGTKMDYEPVKEVVRGTRVFTGSHKSAADNLGFLTLTGEEILIPIDGQHRAKALDFAIRGQDDTNKELDFRGNANLAQEDVTLLLIRFDSEPEKAKGRRIFAKVNRYAKRPTKSETLIIDDDDIAAVFARRMTEPEEDFFSGDLVRLAGNTLPEPAGEFTTLPTIYEINREILIQKKHSYNQHERPGKEEEKLYWKETENVWKALIENITLFSSALKDTSKDGNATRQDIRREFLLGKPIGQRVLAGSFLELTERGRLTTGQACERLNAIDWRISNVMWVGILTRDASRVLSGVGAIKLGRDFVSYLAGRPLSEADELMLRERISPDDPYYRLPSRVSPEITTWSDA